MLYLLHTCIYRIASNFRIVDHNCIFRIVEHHTKIKTTNISLHNNYVLRHYAELYEYLNYEILKWIVLRKKRCTNELPAIRYTS